MSTRITAEGFMVVDGDTHLSQWIENTKRLDCDAFCRNVCDLVIKPGMIVVDGGACLGDHTAAYLNAVGETGHVIAFEPNPVAYSCLVHNCPKAECHQWGLGAKDGELFLTANENIGASFLNGQDGLRVHVVALDVFNLQRLDLLKLDVEGMELDAIRGAVQTIRRCHPVIFLELNDATLARRGNNRIELIQFLNELGYEIDNSVGSEELNEPQLDVLFFHKQ